jgi:hypothetical protein
VSLCSTTTLPTWPTRIASLLLAFAPAANAIPPGKAVITLTPKFGPVTFSHQHHSELDSVQCVTCHHTVVSADEPIRSCYGCHQATYYSIDRIVKSGPETAAAHGIEPQIRDAQRAFHDLCIDCHKARREQELPTGPDDSCRDCHE